MTARPLAQPATKLRFLCIGAHPDDCEIQFGGTAALLAAAGHAVKFLSVTSGNAGHHVMNGKDLAARRADESAEAARRLQVRTETLPNPDAELLPSLELRYELVRQIRRFDADVVLTHRPFDYHPDHRYTGQLVQDSAYLVLVPHICTDTPALDRNPVYLYLEDRFERPVPFRPDLAVDITSVWDRKIHAMAAHESQFFEWLPWIDRRLNEVPANGSREGWLAKEWSRPITPEVREALVLRYGRARGCAAQHAEAFELCEYGTRLSGRELDKLFSV